MPVFGNNGEVEAVAGTTRDVTDRKATEQALREVDRKKDDFIALLAHELRKSPCTGSQRFTSDPSVK